MYENLHVARVSAEDAAALLQSREENFMYVDNWELDRYSVSENEGGNNLDFATAGDPRVPTEYVGVSRFDSETPMYRYLKLTRRAASSVYPWGPYHKDNLQGGMDLSLVIPGNEANNPNYNLTDCRDGEA